MFSLCVLCAIESNGANRIDSHNHDQLISISISIMSPFQTVIVNTFAVLIAFSWLTVVHSQQNAVPSSPCPSVFQYKFSDNDWHGELEVPSPPIEHREVILQVSLSLRASTDVSG